MAGINDNLIEDYRNVITNEILSNETIVKVLSNGMCDVESADELLWEHLVPQQYIPDTITETGSYILYDLDEEVLFSKGSNRSTYVELTLYFWVFTHKDMPKYKERLRNDILTKELKKLFGGVNNMGIARNHLIYNKVYDRINGKYAGRLMAFRITDWSDKIRGLTVGD